MAWSDEARAAAAEARRKSAAAKLASAKAERTGKEEDHSAAMLAHRTAAKAHEDALTAQGEKHAFLNPKVREHDEKANEHMHKSEELRGNEERPDPKKDLGPTSAPGEANRRSAAAGKASLKAERTGDPQEHLNAAAMHRAAESAHRASGNDRAADKEADLAEHHEKTAQKAGAKKEDEDAMDKAKVSSSSKGQGSHDEQKAALQARVRSKKANQTSDRVVAAGNSAEGYEHERAAELHDKAADAHEAVGNHEEAQAHREAANQHRNLASTNTSDMSWSPDDASTGRHLRHAAKARKAVKESVAKVRALNSAKREESKKGPGFSP